MVTLIETDSGGKSWLTNLVGFRREEGLEYIVEVDIGVWGQWGSGVLQLGALGLD